MDEPDIVPLPAFLAIAVGYLNKLGVNLQKRTKALTDTKINAEYLDSVENVRKVNEKIAMICLLSKRSIERVEGSVRDRIELFLNSMPSENTGISANNNEVANSSNSATPSQPKTKDISEESDSRKVTIGNRALSIPENTDFKHYLQCRVLITPYPKETANNIIEKIHNRKKYTQNNDNESVNNNISETDDKLPCSKFKNFKDFTVKKEDKKMDKWSSSYSVTAHRQKTASSKKRKKIRHIISSDSDSEHRKPNIEENKPHSSSLQSSGSPKCYKQTLINFKKSSKSSDDKKRESSDIGKDQRMAREENNTSEEISRQTDSGNTDNKIACDSGGSNSLHNKIVSRNAEKHLNSSDRNLDSPSDETSFKSKKIKIDQKSDEEGERSFESRTKYKQKSKNRDKISKTDDGHGRGSGIKTVDKNTVQTEAIDDEPVAGTSDREIVIDKSNSKELVPRVILRPSLDDIASVESNSVKTVDKNTVKTKVMIDDEPVAGTSDREIVIDNSISKELVPRVILRPSLDDIASVESNSVKTVDKNTVKTKVMDDEPVAGTSDREIVIDKSISKELVPRVILRPSLDDIASVESTPVDGGTDSTTDQETVMDKSTSKESAVQPPSNVMGNVTETDSNIKSDENDSKNKDCTSSSDENTNSSFPNLSSDQDKNLIKSPIKGTVANNKTSDDDNDETTDVGKKNNLETTPCTPKPLIRCISINKLLASKDQSVPAISSPKIVTFNDTPIKIMFPEILTPSKGLQNLIGCSPKPAIKPTNYVYEPILTKSSKGIKNKTKPRKGIDTKLTALLKQIKDDIVTGKMVSEVKIERLLSKNLAKVLEDFHLDRIYNEFSQLIVTSKRLNEDARAVLVSSNSSESDVNQQNVSDSLSNCESQPSEVHLKRKKKFSKKKRRKGVLDDTDSDDDDKSSKRKKKHCGRGKIGETHSDDHDDSGNSEMGRSLRLKGRGDTSAADKDSNRNKSGPSAEKSGNASTDKSSKTEESLLEVMTNGTQDGPGDLKSDDDSSSDQQSESNPKVKKMSVSFAEKPIRLIKTDLLQDSSSSNRDCDSPPKLNGKSKAAPKPAPTSPQITDEITILDSDDEDPKQTEKMEEDKESESDGSSKKRPKKINIGSLKSESETSNSEEEEKPKKKTKNTKVNGKESPKSDEEDGSDAAAKRKSDGSDSGESEIFQPARRKRKQKKKSSGESSEGSGTEGNSQTQKRRRIKRASDDESSGEGDSSGSEGGKRGRKNIRAVKRSSKLDDATRNAARQEKERVQRISERQKLYNESMFDESGRPDEVVKLDKVVLDFDPETKEPTISVDRGLVFKLKPHQGNGIKFMWDACFESVKEIKNTKGSGCILAHCMGLGKTLQVVTLVHTLLLHKAMTKVERVLVVCPLSTVLNWVNEFTMWLEHAHSEDEVNIYELSRFKQNYERANQLKDWLDCGGVCVLGYEMFRNLSADNNKKFKKAQLATFQKALVDPGPDLVVCDEGHLLKNEKTSLSQSMNRVKTLRRIVLTGTPLQNNLKEYYCMVQFVKPNLLGKYNEYLNRFVNPITNGQYTDSTEQDIRVMKRRSHVLHKMLDGAVQRRDYAVLAPFLPPKHEYVLFISLTEIQIKLYSYYLENFSRRPHPDRKNTGFLFPDFQSLQRIWTHPLVMKANSERYELLQQKKRDKEEEEDEDSEGSLVDFIDDEDSTDTPDTSESEMSDMSDDRRRVKKKKKKKGKQAHKTVHKRLTRANANTAVDDIEDDIIEVKPEETRLENPTEWWISLCSEEELNDIRHSNKLLILLDILKQCDAIGDKLLVFSQSLYSLDLIEQFLAKIDDATQSDRKDDALGGHVGSWSQGLDYFRLDGSTSCENRAIWCKSFNREDNPRARLFLISTRAGGLGINLVAANRVVIFDMSWNPSHDVQSIFRVYRFGQKKPCYVYRFLALGTMEEKIYERQVTKQAISKRVIDEQQIDRHYAESDLAELYTFCPVPEGAREVPKLPRDRLFADLLRQHDTVIYKYHEHDSLLENKEEETLTEEERKAAWDDYENEKTRPPPQVFGGSFLANFQQQQQQQIAINALTSVLRQDYPGISDQNLASMIPILLQQMHQSGDAPLMQKMMAAQNMIAGAYKYPQNNMLLNPVNLAAANNLGGVNRAVAGAPSYQYSWQQQQQLQLQRLQQQQALQANMNMKYYAGGLGSRDSMDMAALQQRQRALLLGAAGNSAAGVGLPLPRGRPRHTQQPGEVVDLDSE